MIKHDAIRRALGAAWVLIFLTSFLLPMGIARGAPQAQADATETAEPAPYVAAQSELPPAIEVAAPEAEPPAQPASQPSGQILASRATLEVRQSLVQTSPPGATAWSSAEGTMPVTEGFRIRTDASGSARLVYLEGSVTTIGPNSGILVQRLQQTEGGNPIVRLFQNAGTTLHRVLQLTDAAASYEVETPAATAFVRGTELVVQEFRPRLASAPASDSLRLLSASAQGEPQAFLLQNVSTPCGRDPVPVEGFGRRVTIAGCQETLAIVGTGPSDPRPLGSTAQSLQNQQQAAANQAGATASQGQAAVAAAAAQQGALQAAIIQQQLLQQQLLQPPPPPLPPPPPPPPPPGFNPNLNIVLPCITPTRTPTVTLTPSITPTPTSTPTFTPTPTATVATLVPTNTSTPTPIPTGITATPVVVSPASVSFFGPAPVCTPVPSSEFTSQTYTGRTFNVTASVISNAVLASPPNPAPTILLQTTRGTETFSCANTGPGVPTPGGLQFTTTCTGTTQGTILAGTPVFVRWPVTGGGFIESRGFTPPTLSLDPSGTFVATIIDVDPALLAEWLRDAVSALPPAPAARLTDYGASLLHAPFDAVRQEVAPEPEPAAGGPPPLLGAVPRTEPRERFGWRPTGGPHRL